MQTHRLCGHPLSLVSARDMCDLKTLNVEILTRQVYSRFSMGNGGVCWLLKTCALKKMPDLDRMLAVIKIIGNLRAKMYIYVFCICMYITINVYTYTNIHKDVGP